MKIPISSICVAAFPLDRKPVLSSVKTGAIHLLTGERFSFERGAGIWRNGKQCRVPTGSSDLKSLRFSLEREWPELKETMHRWHQGATGQYAWDLATTIPLMWEAGFVATHSDGTPLDDVRIDDGSVGNIHDVLIARTAEVHQYVVDTIARQEKFLRDNRERFLDLLTTS
jgi:fructose-1,6-bisphosphatase/inositol monophosphatase family enzyme